MINAYLKPINGLASHFFFRKGYCYLQGCRSSDRKTDKNDEKFDQIHFWASSRGLFMSSMTLRLKRRTFGWRALTQVKAGEKVTDDDGLSGKRNSAQHALSAKVMYF